MSQSIRRAARFVLVGDLDPVPAGGRADAPTSFPLLGRAVEPVLVEVSESRPDMSRRVDRESIVFGDRVRRPVSRLALRRRVMFALRQPGFGDEARLDDPPVEQVGRDRQIHRTGSDPEGNHPAQALDEDGAVGRRDAAESKGAAGAGETKRHRRQDDAIKAKMEGRKP